MKRFVVNFNTRDKYCNLREASYAELINQYAESYGLTIIQITDVGTDGILVLFEEEGAE